MQFFSAFYTRGKRELQYTVTSAVNRVVGGSSPSPAEMPVSSVGRAPNVPFMFLPRLSYFISGVNYVKI